MVLIDLMMVSFLKDVLLLIFCFISFFLIHAGGGEDGLRSQKAASEAEGRRFNSCQGAPNISRAYVNA